MHQQCQDIIFCLKRSHIIAKCTRVKTVTIPNKEVSQEYVNAISTMAWNEVLRSIENSRKLLQALWEQDEKAVAEGIDQAHGEISVLQYNNENSYHMIIFSGKIKRQRNRAAQRILIIILQH